MAECRSCVALSAPDDWDYPLAGLVKINPEGKDVISATLRELEQAGYLRRHQLVDSRGRFSRMEYNTMKKRW